MVQSKENQKIRFSNSTPVDESPPVIDLFKYSGPGYFIIIVLGTGPLERIDRRG